MSETHDPYLQRLGDELERAVEDAIRRESERRQWFPRRGFLRLAVLGFAATALLGGSAFAAGSVLGVIDLGNGVRAEQIMGAPEWDGISGSFVNSPVSREYVYHVVGGSALALSCGAADLWPTNNIYVRSIKPLDEGELRALLADEFIRAPLFGSALKREAIAKLHARRHRHPRQARTRATALPAGVLSMSDECPPSSALVPATPLSPLPNIGPADAIKRRAR